MAVPRRRSFLFGGLALTLCASFAASSWEGGRGAPSVSIAAARRATYAAVRTLRPTAPATARLIDHLVADAEVIHADERTSLPWDRTPGRVETAWTRALLVARRGLVDLHSRNTTLASRWAGLEGNVGADVRRALAEAEEAGIGMREISAAKQANLKWDLARRYAASGAVDRALVEAEQAQDFSRIVHGGFTALHERFGERKNLVLWRRMAQETIARSRETGEAVLIVDKLRRRLYLYQAGVRIGTYEAELGAKGLKQKMHAGDQATPEGEYRVARLRGEGQSHYYKALLIDYPNDADRTRFAWGQRAGLISRRAGIGSLIEIHGEGGQGRDWTDGCVALSNRDMDRVFARARLGMYVTIVGTL